MPKKALIAVSSACKALVRIFRQMAEKTGLGIWRVQREKWVEHQEMTRSDRLRLADAELLFSS